MPRSASFQPRSRKCSSARREQVTRHEGPGYGEGEDGFFTAAEAGGEECPEQPASVAELVVKQPHCRVAVRAGWLRLRRYAGRMSDSPDVARGLSVGEGTMRGTILRTERLLLRPFKESDVDEVLNYRDDAAFARFLPHLPQPFTRADAEQFVAVNMAEPWEQFATFAVTLDARLIGTVNLDIDAHNQLAMLGYAISRDRWGEGIAFEAAHAVMSWGFQTLHLAKIWASTDARHQRSRRVMEKLGMQHEGTLRAHSLGRDGVRTDQVMYGLLREEWEATVNPPSAGTN